MHGMLRRRGGGGDEEEERDRYQREAEEKDPKSELGSFYSFSSGALLCNCSSVYSRPWRTNDGIHFKIKASRDKLSDLKPQLDAALTVKPSRDAQQKQK